ncbi:transaldolase family protein [Streptomyces sp. NPDC058678]
MRPQRPLWASTGVKDSSYADTRYVDELVAPGVVNTMPEQTLRSVADHGRIQGDTIHGTYAASQQVLDDLEAAGVPYDDVVRVLEEQGTAKFTASGTELFDQLDSDLRAKDLAA